MMRVVGSGHVNPPENSFRIQALEFTHLNNPLRSERVFCINYKDVAVKPASLRRSCSVDSQLMHYLSFPGSELAKEFCDCLSFETTTQEIVKVLAAGGKLAHFPALLKNLLPCFKVPHIGVLSGSIYYLHCTAFDCSRDHREVLWRRYRNRHYIVISIFPQFLRCGLSYA